MSSEETQSCTEGSPKDNENDEEDDVFSQSIPVHDQRTVHISNLHERTTHKDLVEVIRGGRLLNVFLRNDRTAAVSFVEGAPEFLAYAKRNDIYLHTRRVSTLLPCLQVFELTFQLEFRWSDRHFRVPAHISYKITRCGATRNLVLRGAAEKITADEIRDHLDHIHNLVIISIYFKNGDAYVSMNSIHNALYARTCMLSRSAYKGVRIDYYADECAAPVPRPISRARNPEALTSRKYKPTANQYAILDTGSECGSDEGKAGMKTGVRADGYDWADAAMA